MNEKDTGKSKTEEMKSLRKQILEWLGILAIAAVMLFFFAPESWWQFGVSPVEQRKAASGNFTLPKLEGGEWNFSEQRGKVVDFEIGMPDSVESPHWPHRSIDYGTARGAGAGSIRTRAMRWPFMGGRRHPDPSAVYDLEGSSGQLGIPA